MEDSAFQEFDEELADLFNLDTTPAPTPQEATEAEIEADKAASVNYPVAVKDRTKQVSVTAEERTKDAESDYDFSRRTLHHSIEEGSKALGTLVTFATGSGGPEAFKTVGGLMDSLAKSTKQLLELQEQMNKATGLRAPGSQPKQTAQQITNNTTIVADGGQPAFTGTREEAMAARRAARKARAESAEIVEEAKVVN